MGTGRPSWGMAAFLLVCDLHPTVFATQAITMELHTFGSMLWRKQCSVRAHPLSFIEPCIAVARETIPQGPCWVHAIKHQLPHANPQRMAIAWAFYTGWFRLAERRLIAETASIDGEATFCSDSLIGCFAPAHG